MEMERWQIENSETSEISEILFQVFLFPCFRFCPTAKIENWDLKISEKNSRDFRISGLANVKTRDLHHKLKARVASWIAEQLRT